MLERYAVKVARTVLRGGSGSNATSLPDHPPPPIGTGQGECGIGQLQIPIREEV